MFSTAGVPVAAHGILLGTAVVWVVLELRQALHRRAGAEKAGWGGEIAFRLIVGAGVLLAGLFVHNARGAAIGPPLPPPGSGLACCGAARPCACGAFTLWAVTSPSSSRRAKISR